MKRQRKAFTIVELLTVIAIIAILTGILIPALKMINDAAKKTKQKAQLATIAMGLTAFRNDYGDYPSSSLNLPSPQGGLYCGSQKLCEAILGWDLMGFHPNTAWRGDGKDNNNGPLTYDPIPKMRGTDSLYERKGLYIELTTANAFKICNNLTTQDGLYNNYNPSMNPNTFVLCDIYGVRKINQGNKTVKAGTPILYYKANTASKTLDTSHIVSSLGELIYDARDNAPIYDLGPITSTGAPDTTGRLHSFGQDGNLYPHFYDYDFNYGIINSKISNPSNAATVPPWPHRPDSYLLITAGPDGLYGTSDDITNFGN